MTINRNETRLNVKEHAAIKRFGEQHLKKVIILSYKPMTKEEYGLGKYSNRK